MIKEKKLPTKFRHGINFSAFRHPVLSALHFPFSGILEKVKQTVLVCFHCVLYYKCLDVFLVFTVKHILSFEQKSGNTAVGLKELFLLRFLLLSFLKLEENAQNIIFIDYVIVKEVRHFIVLEKIGPVHTFSSIIVRKSRKTESDAFSL